MKSNFLKSSILFASIAMIAVSCSKQDDLNIPDNGSGEGSVVPATLTAVIDGDNYTPADDNDSYNGSSKVGFDDQGASGVKLSWSANDSIGLYDTGTGKIKAVFTLSSGAGQKSGTFTLSRGTFVSTNTYTVVYPQKGETNMAARQKILASQTQAGNNTTSHLSAVCFMSGTNTGNTVSLTHDLAMLTVKMPTPLAYLLSTDGAPKSLTVTNGSDSYSLNISGISDWNSQITAFLMINPNSVASRKLSFTMHTANGSVFRSEFTATGTHAKQNRYTADLSQSGKTMSKVSGITLLDLATAALTQDVWVINDLISAVTDLTLIKTALNTVNTLNPARRIKIILTNASAIANDAFSGFPALQALDLPAVTSVGTNAFKNCVNLISVSLPKVTSIGASAFEGVTSLTSIALPAATSIGNNAFKGATHLVSASLPTVVTIGNNVFEGATSLVSTVLPAAISIGSNVFKDCTSLVSATLPKVTSIGNNAFENCNVLNKLVVGVSNLSALTSVGTNLFVGVTLGGLTLTIGATEYNANVTGTGSLSWRNYGPIGTIVKVQ